MRILKCITINYKRSEPCPHHNDIMIGDKGCYNCEYFRGSMRRDGTVTGKYGDGKPLLLCDVNVIGTNKIPRHLRDSENLWWYIRCIHPIN